MVAKSESSSESYSSDDDEAHEPVHAAEPVGSKSKQKPKVKTTPASATKKGENILSCANQSDSCELPLMTP